MPERIAKTVRYNKDLVHGAEAQLWIYDPGKGKWSKKKWGPNDAEFAVTFPAGFHGERNAFVIGSDGGFDSVRIEVE
jgi:hypothetical protein